MSGNVQWNGKFPIGPVRPEKWSSSKGFQLGRTVPLSFEPKFPEILVEWIAPFPPFWLFMCAFFGENEEQPTGRYKLHSIIYVLQLVSGLKNIGFFPLINTQGNCNTCRDFSSLWDQFWRHLSLNELHSVRL